jgi:hypothetical protein
MIVVKLLVNRLNEGYVKQSVSRLKAPTYYRHVVNAVSNSHDHETIIPSTLRTGLCPDHYDFLCHAMLHV